MHAGRTLRAQAAVLVVVLLGLLVALSQADEPAKRQTAAKPPYQRLLSGDDAKKAAELEQQLAELEAASRYAAAHQLAKEVQALRARQQGADHWQAVDAGWKADTLQTVAALPAEKQQAWAALSRLAREGQQLQQEGRYAEAEPRRRQVLEGRRQVLGDEHPFTAQAYNSVGTTLAGQGKYAEAAHLYRQALAICRKALGDEHPHTAYSYNNLADNLNSRGLRAEAAPLVRQALAIRRRALGEAHPDTAQSYNSMAINLDARGRRAEAEPLFRRALAIYQKAPGEEHPHTARSYNNLAYNLQAQGKYAEAEPLFRQALAISERTLGEEHPHTATSCNNVAANLHAQGRHDEAALLVRRALAIHQKVLGEEHPDTASSYMNVASNLRVQGQHAAALAPLHAAAQTYEAARLRVGARGLDRAAFPRKSPWPLLAAALAHVGRPADAWQALESNLARGLLDEAGSRRGIELSPAERQQQQALEQQLNRLQASILQLVTKKGGTESDRKQVEELIHERAGAERELARLAAELSRRAVVCLPRLQAQLAADAALVAWVDFTDYRGAIQEHWGCVVRATGVPAWVRLPGSGKGGAWTEDSMWGKPVRAALANREVPASEGKALMRRLEAQRLAPLQPHLDGVRRLFVVPVNAMAGLPVEALTERYTVSYITSGTQLVKLCEQQRPPAARTLLALGDPVFLPPDKTQPKDPAAIDAYRGPAFARLPGTAREVQAIARLFDESTRLLGSDASEQKLEALRASLGLAGFRYLHFATHGQADMAALESALILAQDALPDPLQQQLAGQRVFDGRLTANEVLETWKLEAELVTLSACESGLGRQGGGEGLLGFSQAFLLAGARSVVLSLWKVDDTATALLMVRFYQNLLGRREGLKARLSKAEALREAKQWLRNLTAEEAEKLAAGLPGEVRGGVRERGKPEAGTKPYAHPYYWAAFILIGDPD